MRVKLGWVVVELDVREASWIEASFMAIRLMAVRLRTMRLGRKFEKGLSPKIRLSPKRR